MGGKFMQIGEELRHNRTRYLSISREMERKGLQIMQTKTCFDIFIYIYIYILYIYIIYIYIYI